MTLILSSFVDDYIIQVSDRRFTYEGFFAPDDNKNKAVLYTSDDVVIAFAITGLGYINKQRADEWLADTLWRVQTDDFWETVNSVGFEAQTEFNKMSNPIISKAIEFIGVGWKKDAPFAVIISNNSQSNDENLNVADDSFFYKVLNFGKQNNVFHVESNGQQISSCDIEILNFKIKYCYEANKSPEVVANILINEIHKIANSNPKVGKNLMVVCLPRNYNPWSSHNFNSNIISLAEDTISTFYVSEIGEKKTVFMPNKVSRGIYMKNPSIITKDEHGIDTCAITYELLEINPDEYKKREPITLIPSQKNKDKKHI